MREKNKDSKIVFVSYAYEDDSLRKELDKHLNVLRRQNPIQIWHSHDIRAGTERRQEIIKCINLADIILLLISPDFMQSDDCYNVEMVQALRRYERGEASVIPIIVRPVRWQEAPFSHLTVLPTNIKPITQWDNRDAAFLDVVERIREVVNRESFSGNAENESIQGGGPDCLTNLSLWALDSPQRSLPFWLFFVRRITAQVQDRDCYRRYCRYLISEHQMFAVKGLNIRTAHNLELEQVFIDLRLKDMPAHQVSADLLHPPESLHGPHSIWDYLSSKELAKHHLIVLGAPGSGKTTLLKHLAWTLAQSKRRFQRRRGRHTFPILLFLRDHVSTIVNQPNFSLAQAIHNHIQQKWEQPIPITWIHQHLGQKHCLILLDGLDEVADSQKRQLVADWVQKQFIVHCGNRFVLTSRPYGYRDNQLDGVAVLDVQAFTLPQVKQFVKKWYTANETLRSRKVDAGIHLRVHQRAEDLQRNLQQSPALRELMINPLLLTMILTVHHVCGSLPENRVELYTKMCEVLLNRRQEAHDVAQDLSSAQKQHVLRPLAYFLMQQGMREIEREKAAVVIAPALECVNKHIHPIDFLPLTENTSGLLLDRGSGLYSFAHLTFQEYLAAVYIKEMELEQNLLAQVSNHWWHETILFYCAQTDATAIVQACLAQSPPTIDALGLAFECDEVKLKLQPEVQAQLNAIKEDADPQWRQVASEACLRRRLDRMIPLQANMYADTSLLTCAEYQLFLDEKRAEGHYHQPDHWTTFSFPKGSGNTPVLGIRRSDAEAFCKWLTARDEERWHYRLPRAEDWPLEDWPLKEQEQWKDLGYWITYGGNNSHFVWVQGKPSLRGEPSTALQQRMRNLYNAFTHALDSDFLHLRTSGILPDWLPGRYDRKRTCRRTFADAFADIFDLDGALDLLHTLDDLRDFDRTYFRDCDFASHFENIFGLDRALNLLHTLDHLRDVDHPCPQDRSLILALALALFYTQTSADLLACQSAIGDFIPITPLDHVPSCALRGAVGLYVMLFLLQERIAGNLPAYEGILLVKEPQGTVLAL